MTFPTTRWSLIRESGDADAARAAWSELATRYRAAIVAWFRRRFGPDRAEDLTQAFFAASIEGGWWSRADVERGSFRTYLRTMLHRFGARHGRGAAAADLEPDALADDGPGPDAAYERSFAQALVARALARVGADHPGDPLLAHVLERGDQGDVAALATALGVPPNTVSQRLRRMRMRLREALREEFADLVDDPSRVDAELAELRGVLGG